jgi:hypothetical protein
MRLFLFIRNPEKTKQKEKIIQHPKWESAKAKRSFFLYIFDREREGTRETFFLLSTFCVSSVLAYLCLTRFFFCFALSHESAVLLLFTSHGLLLLAFAFFLTTGWTDGWMDWRERNNMGKPVVLAFFVIHYYCFLCGRRAWETLFIWEIELVVEKTRGLVLVEQYLERERDGLGGLNGTYHYSHLYCHCHGCLTVRFV